MTNEEIEPTVSDPDVVEGSARQTTANFIKSRRYLNDELAPFSDVAISIAVEVADHRTCFRRDCGYDFCHGCDDVIAWAKDIDGRIAQALASARNAERERITNAMEKLHVRSVVGTTRGGVFRQDVLDAIHNEP